MPMPMSEWVPREVPVQWNDNIADDPQDQEDDEDDDTIHVTPARARALARIVALRLQYADLWPQRPGT